MNTSVNRYRLRLDLLLLCVRVCVSTCPDMSALFVLFSSFVLSVVCVGGDGMFSELLHGVIGRTQQEAGLSEHDPNGVLRPCDLHIGIIPAGHTIYLVYSVLTHWSTPTQEGDMFFLNKSRGSQGNNNTRKPELKETQGTARECRGCRV